MTVPAITAIEANGALVVRDEFQWGFFGGLPLRWRILDCSEEGILAVTVSSVQERAFSEGAQEWLDAFAQESLEGQAERVFLLSVEEAERYFHTEAARTAEGENRNWWLADEGGAEGFQSYVHSNGWINEFGAEAASAYAAMRPAVFLQPSQVAFKLGVADGGAEPELVSAADILGQCDVLLASEYGEELMLEALEQEDIFVLEDFVTRFGVHESWETTLVDALNQLSAEGDSLQVTRLLDMCGGIEFMGSALAEAMACGHIAMAGTLLRAGASLTGEVKGSGLLGDTPELRRVRKSGYPSSQELCETVINGEEGFHSIGSLIRQGLLSGSNYHALLCVAGKDPDAQELFEWMLCPDHEPVGHLTAYLSKKRIYVTEHSQPNAVPVSEWALRMLWYPALIQDNPDTVHAMARYLTDSKMEGKRQLLCFLAQVATQQELQRILSGKKVFSPKDIAAAIASAEAANKTRNVAFLSDFLRSIGAGRLLQND